MKAKLFHLVNVTQSKHDSYAIPISVGLLRDIFEFIDRTEKFEEESEDWEIEIKSLEEENSNLQNKVEELEEEVKYLNSDIEALEATQGTLEDEIYSLKQNIRFMKNFDAQDFLELKKKLNDIRNFIHAEKTRVRKKTEYVSLVEDIYSRLCRL